MECRKFDLDMLREICMSQMPQDFPAAEIKPFSMIQQLYAKGLYSGYGFYDDQTLLGYALFCGTPDKKYLLLDYLAVLAPFRSGGLGSQMLACIRDSFAAYHALLLEVEDDDYAPTAAEQELQSRRIRFYQRNGVKMSAVRSYVYRCRFKIMYMELQESMDNRTVYNALDAVYHTLFTPVQLARHVEISNLE